jgi:hypothetical protein
MKNHEGAHPKSVSWAGPVALLGATGAAALRLWQAHGADARLWPAVALLALTAALGLVWLHRVRGARRFFAMLDAYTERELAHAAPRPHTHSVASDPALASNV